MTLTSDLESSVCKGREGFEKSCSNSAVPRVKAIEAVISESLS